MPLPDRPVWRLLTSTLLAVVLGIGVVAGTVAQDSAPVAPPAKVAAPVPSVPPGEVKGITDPPSDTGAGIGPVVDAVDPNDLSAHLARAVVATAPKPVPTTRPKPARVPATATAPASAYKGRNHVWMPALKVDKAVSWYACSNSAYPGNRVYRWGCAGSNNVYLFGHASSVFQPLHDAYVDGRLRKGMALWYANADGVVHRYAISWWKVTTPTDGVWAYAAQSKPSLTLQTCLGSQSQYRLIVRLTQVD
jgi:hypothetical protein